MIIKDHQQQLKFIIVLYSLNFHNDAGLRSMLDKYGLFEFFWNFN